MSEARDLMPLPGCGEDWRDFEAAVDRTRQVACDTGSEHLDDLLLATARLLVDAERCTSELKRAQAEAQMWRNFAALAPFASSALTHHRERRQGCACQVAGADAVSGCGAAR